MRFFLFGSFLSSGLRVRTTGGEGLAMTGGLFSRVETYRLLAGKVFHSKAEVAQNSCQGAFRNVTSALGNGSEAFVHGVPPDFMGAGTLSDKLESSLRSFLVNTR